MVYRNAYEDEWQGAHSIQHLPNFVMRVFDSPGVTSCARIRRHVRSGFH
jgi:hypothetical protein